MTRLILAALCLLAVGACDEATMAGQTGPVTGPDTGLDTGLPDPSVATCMSAVAQRTGIGIVAPSKISSNLTGKTVTVGVGDARTPWECRFNQSGGLTSVAPVA